MNRSTSLLLKVAGMLAAVLLLLYLTISPRAESADPHLEEARRILSSTPLIDGHNDLPWAIRTRTAGDVEAYDLLRRTPGHTDIDRLRRGMVGAQFWSVYIPGELDPDEYLRTQLEQIDIARRLVARYPEHLAWALSANDIERVFQEGKIGSLLGVEGGHGIQNSLGVLRTFYDLGVRYMTLTHNVTHEWADAATGRQVHGGLSPFGREVVREMNRLGMLVDLSHVSPATMRQAIEVSTAPIIFSHSSARALANVPRNVPDDVLRLLPQNGGIVMITFVPAFISQELVNHNHLDRQYAAELRQRYADDDMARAEAVARWREANPAPRATLSQVADHIEHVRRVAGVDHVGIGADYDGISEVVVGLEDVSTYPALFAELLRRGWEEEDLRKLAGENILRVMREADAVANRLREERRPSTRTLQELNRR